MGDRSASPDEAELPVDEDIVGPFSRHGRRRRENTLLRRLRTLNAIQALRLVWDLTVDDQAAKSAPTADSVIQAIVEKTPKDSPTWTPQDTRKSLDELRRINGDAWIVANASILESQMLAIAYF